MALIAPHQVRELTLTAVAAVASDDVLAERLVLKGGNALQLVYQVGSRASTDLDFSIAGDDMDAEELRVRLGAALRREFAKEGYRVFDFRCEPRPKDPKLENWGGYTAEFKLVREADIPLLETSERERLGKKQARSVERALPATAGRKVRKELRTVRAAIAAAPAALTEDQRVEVWRRNSHQPYRIEVSKYEYVEGHVRKTVKHYDCAVYTPAMIAAEKLRAICQQMPEFRGGQRTATPRARDFYDIHALATSSLKVDVAAAPDLVRAMFKVKDVPLRLLGAIRETREFHRTNWETVVQAIPAGQKPDAFDFYFDFVLGEVGRLEALWKPDSPA